MLVFLKILVILLISISCDSELEADADLNNVNTEKLEENSKLSDVVSFDPKDFCTDIVFLNRDGEPEKGKRDCAIDIVDKNCTFSGETNCFIGDEGSFLENDDLKPSYLKSGVAIGNIIGTLVSPSKECSKNFEIGCLANPSFKSIDTTNLVSSNIKSEITIGGISGSIIIDHLDCSSNAQVNCITTESYKAADLTNLTSANIKKGVSIAGQTGDYPSAINRLNGNTATTDLTAATLNTKLTSADSFEFFDSAGNLQSSAGDTNLAAGNILTGKILFGVAGSASAVPANCTSNGEQSCVTTATFKAADLTNLTAGNIKNGVSIAGQAGNYPSATNPLSGNTAAADLTSATLNAKLVSASAFEFFDSAGNLQSSVGDADLTSANIKSGNNIFGVDGSVIPSPADCSANSEVGCVSTATYKAADLTNLLNTNIRTGVNIAGIIGNVEVKPADCSSNSEIGCVATTSYKAADFTNIVAGNIKSGVTAAGVSGNYPSSSYPLTGASGTVDLTSANLNSALASTTPFEYWTSTGVRQTGTGDTDFIASNLKDSISMFGVTGSLTGSPPNCSSDGETGCVTVTSYKAVDMSNVSAGTVKSGITIGGVSGDYPSNTYPLAGASVTADLTSSGFNAALTSSSSFEYWTSSGVRYTGSGDTDFSATNIKNSVSMFGLTGSVFESPSNCSIDGQTNCVAVTAFKAADMSNVSAGTIKSGSTIAGISGEYPSSTYKLPSAGGAASLTNATFNAKVKSATSFEYWDESGTRHTGSGDSDIKTENLKESVSVFGTNGSLIGSLSIDPWNIRSNVTIGSVTGSLKANCRNTIISLRFNADSFPLSNTDNTTSGSTNHWWDTHTDDNGGGSFPTMSFPGDWDSSNYCGLSNWEDVTSGTCNSAGKECMYRDNLSGLTWSELNVNDKKWAAGVSYCENLNWGGYTDWRMPTQKELMQSYINGIRSVKSSNFDTGSDVWSSTSFTWTGTGKGVYLNLNTGSGENDLKTTQRGVHCVR